MLYLLFNDDLQELKGSARFGLWKRSNFFQRSTHTEPVYSVSTYLQMGNSSFQAPAML